MRAWGATAMAEMILIEGLASINRSLKMSGPLVANGLRLGMREAAEPVKRDADRLSRSGLSGMKRASKSPPPWSVQKIGQTQHEVYIKPTQRGLRGRSRSAGENRRASKFVELMYGRSYDPALDRNRGLVRAIVDAQLSRVVRGV